MTTTTTSMTRHKDWNSLSKEQPRSTPSPLKPTQQEQVAASKHHAASPKRVKATDDEDAGHTDEVFEEEDMDDTDDEEQEAAVTYNHDVLNNPPAPQNLPPIYRELCFLLAAVPGRINWDVLTQKATPELGQVIQTKREGNNVGFTESPYKELFQENSTTLL